MGRMGARPSCAAACSTSLAAFVSASGQSKLGGPVTRRLITRQGDRIGELENSAAAQRRGCELQKEVEAIVVPLSRSWSVPSQEGVRGTRGHCRGSLVGRTRLPRARRVRVPLPWRLSGPRLAK
jgi:hypothetical protein